MSKIIHSLRRIPIARQYVTIPDEDNYSRPRQYAKNLLRQHVTRLSAAIVEATSRMNLSLAKP